jgi:hypothetical protein
MIRMHHCLCLLALAGCQTARIQPPEAGPPPPPLIRLFGHEVPPDKESITQEVLAHVTPGMDFEQARLTMAANGFDCRRVYDISQLWSPLSPPEVNLDTRIVYSKERMMLKPVYCVTRKDELSRWGKEYKIALVLLYPDKERRRLDSVLVFVGSRPHPDHSFFEKHPELQEPVGQPVDEAERQMQAAGFKCSRKTNAAGSPFLLCRYYDERAIGGRIIHINLFYDDGGVVRDSEVAVDCEWFQSERCMLPDADDPTDRFIGKSALFPLREACLLTGEGAVVGLQLLLLGLFPPGWR